MKKMIGIIVLSGIALFTAGCGTKSSPGLDADAYQKAYAQWEADKKVFDDKQSAQITKQTAFLQAEVDELQRVLDNTNAQQKQPGLSLERGLELFRYANDLERQLSDKTQAIDAMTKSLGWQYYSDVVEPPSPSQFKKEK